ncbi:MAG: hypothetical protein JW929_00570 [Anaerolineales bacterium]|nr:hypothetical protein [Anaerolineales bacterium]
MTYQPDCTIPEDLQAKLIEQGLDFLPELFRILLNNAMFKATNSVVVPCRS